MVALASQDVAILNLQARTFRSDSERFSEPRSFFAAKKKTKRETYALRHGTTRVT